MCIRDRVHLEEVRASHGSAKEGLDKILSGQKKLEVAVFELEKHKAINTSRLENLAFDLERAKIGNQQRDEQIGGLKKNLTELQKEEEIQKIALEKLQEEADKRQTQIIQSESQLVEYQAKATKINRELDAKRNEFQLTTSMVENLEGFPESIRFLSKQKDWSLSLIHI